jgi:hypothetical protein
MAILALEKEAWLGCLSGSIPVFNGQHDDRSGMTHNIAASPHAARFFDLIGGNAKHRTLVADT